MKMGSRYNLNHSTRTRVDMAFTQTPGRIQRVDPPKGSVIYTVRVLESRIGGSTFWILPGYSTLYYNIIYLKIPYDTILYYTILYYTILYYTVLHYTTLYYIILFYTTLHYTILYYTMLH